MKTRLTVLFFLLLLSPFAFSGDFAESTSSTESPFLDLQGEWAMDCYKNPAGFYAEDKMAFIGNVLVHSWKWYKDPSCKIKAGEYWDKWKVVVEGYVRNPAGAIGVKMILLDGHETQCPEEWTWLSPTDNVNTLYFGEKCIGDQCLACKEWPKELEKTPFVFVRYLPWWPAYIESYTRSLKREFSE